jgi:hypothetical protein
MNRAPSPWPLVEKELRALLPIWAATLAALALMAVWRRVSSSDVLMVGYIGGVVGLGAHAFGHEYGHGTLAMQLAQPVPRRRLFAIKFMAAAAMLAPIALVATVVFITDPRTVYLSAHVVLPVLAALLLTPTCAMLSRSTLAGTVLGTSGPATIVIVAIIISAFVSQPEDLALTWIAENWAWAAAVACPILALLLWRTFSRLEAIEGMPPLTLARARRTPASPGTRRPDPWRALVRKELHLQQMTIAIAVLMQVIWLMAMILAPNLRPGLPPLAAVLLLYSLGLTIVIGALASAEERQLHTLHLQLLQPIGAFRQWAVKCVVAFGLAFALGVVLPVALIYVTTLPTQQNLAGLIVPVIMLTSGSLYISSLNTSGVKALVWAVPAGILAAIFISTMQTAIAQTSRRIGLPLPVDQTEATGVGALMLAGLIAPVLLGFGFVNHTSSEQPWRRTLRQVAILAAVIVLAIVGTGVLMATPS